MKNFLRLVFSLFIFSIFTCEKTVAQVSFESEVQLVAEANRLFIAADYVNAMPLFSQLLSLHAKDANYNYKFGVCVLHNDEDKTKALQYFDFAVKENTVDREAFFFAGSAYQLNARFDEALGFYEKYKSKLAAGEIDKHDVSRYILQCKNGKNLYDKNVTLQSLEKNETLENEFYRNYDLKAMKGRIIPKPLNFKSKQDKKVDDNTLIFVGTEQSIVYSGYSDDGANTSRELFKVNKLPNGNWGLPVNVGNTVNTPYDEEFAFLHPDGKTLYFSSKGHNTMGGYDIFRSVYDPESGQWSAPVNLAHPVNSPDDDIFYASDNEETFAYFASKNFTKPGKIKVYKISTKGAEQAATVMPVIIKGNFTMNGEPVYAKTEIKVTDKATGKHIGTYTVNKKTGNYLITLPAGKNYALDIVPQDFVSHRLEIAVPAKASQDFFEQKINFHKDGFSETVTLTNLFDATGKTEATNLRSVVLNEQLAEKAKEQNKKVFTAEEFTAYKAQKAEEEKQFAAGKTLPERIAEEARLAKETTKKEEIKAETESNQQEALLKAEAEKKAAEEKQKAEQLAKAKEQEEQQRIAAEKQKADGEAKLKDLADAKALAEKKVADEKQKADEGAKLKAEAEKKAAEEKQKAEQFVKAKEQEEQQLLAAEKQKADEATKLKATADAAAKAEAEKKTAEEKQKAEQLANAKEQEEQQRLSAAEKKKADEEDKLNERVEAERIAAVNAVITEKERKLKELKEKEAAENKKLTASKDSLTPEQAAAYDKIQKEQEASRKAVEEQVKKEKELKAQQTKQDSLNQQKFLAEKSAIDKAQKEKDEQARKVIAEQKLKEQQANAEVEKRNKAVMDSIASANSKKEKTPGDSLAAEQAMKTKLAEEQRIAAEKLKAEMASAEKAALEQANLNKEKPKKEEIKREQEKLKANLEEQNKLIEESLRQQARMKQIADTLAAVEKQKEEAVRLTYEKEKEAAAKAESLRKESELKAAEEKRKTGEEAKMKAEVLEAKAAAEKQKTEEAASAKAIAAKAEAEKQLAQQQKKQEEKKTAAAVESKPVAIDEKNETPEQRKLRLLMQRMNAEEKGREIVENSLKSQQQTGNEALVNSQRYKEVATNKEVVKAHKKEEKIRPPFDKTDLLSHKGVIYKLEVKLSPVHLPSNIPALLKAGTGPSEELVYHYSGAYLSLAEATLDQHELGYKGFSAGIVAYLNGQQIAISEAKKQPVME